MKMYFAILITAFLFLSIHNNSLSDNRVKVEASAQKDFYKSGEEFKVDIKVTLKDNWYVYSLKSQTNAQGDGPTPTEMSFEGNGIQIIKNKFIPPKPKMKFDEGFEMDVEYFDKITIFSVPVKATKDIDFTNDFISAKVLMQLCTDGSCIPPDFYKARVSGKTKAVEAMDITDKNESKAGNTFRKDFENDGKLVLVTDANSKVQFKAIPSKQFVKSGEEFVIALDITTDNYWYTYSTKEQLNKEGIGPTPTQITIDTSNSFILSGKISLPKVKSKMDEGFEMNIEYYEGNFRFELPVKAIRDIDFASSENFVTVYLQMCDTARCLTPEEYFVYISNETYQPQITASKQEFMTEDQKKIEDAKKSGILGFLLFAMSMGGLALLTPCVFPMVPITVSFFTKRAEKNKGRGLIDSTVYALGIIFTFTALGFIMGLIFGASGIQDFATNPWVNLFIAAIFIIFAFNLFGAFEIQIPTGLLNVLNKKSQGSGLTSVLLMGLTFSLTSFTCTVPFVGSSILSASGGEWFYPVIGMLGFSAVFAAPFFLLALFPSYLQKLPKAGGWMNNVKVVMGFLEIAAAIKFISNTDLVWKWGILPKEVFLAIWIGCAILITIYILGLFRFHHDSPVSSVNSVRVLFAIFFTSITVYLFSGLFGKPLGELDAFLPPPDYEQLMTSDASGGTSTIISKVNNDNSGGKVETVWLKNYEEAVKIAQAENKAIFIDFTGFTCTNCRWMETKMFTRQNVSELMNKMIKVKLFTDRMEEPYISNKKFQRAKFNSIDLPLYAILTPQEELIGTKAFTRDEKEFIAFLKRGTN